VGNNAFELVHSLLLVMPTDRKMASGYYNARLLVPKLR
jgi:hypothetical protein